MKWIWSTAAVVVAVSTMASAQSGKGMNDSKMDHGMKATYTGCVEAVNHGGSYLLTHIGEDHKAMMDHDQMDRDHMMTTAVVLTGASDLKKHVGQKVTVTGSVAHGMSEAMPKDPDTLTVASLKVVAKSCS